MDATTVKAKIKEMLCERLDSIDSLEIISAIDEEYGVPMTGVGKEHFKNIDALAAYVVAHAEQ